MAHGWGPCTCGRRMQCGSKCPHRINAVKMTDEEFTDFQEFIMRAIENAGGQPVDIGPSIMPKAVQIIDTVEKLHKEEK